MTRVVVSCAYWRCRGLIREAVDSVLAQTERELRLVVVNDGDPDPPWPDLADITDPRLVRFDLPVNRGIYFAHEVVLRATDAPFFAVQDADDLSAPTRLEKLLAACERDRSPGASSRIGGDYNGKSHSPTFRRVGRSFRHRRCHAGVWRTEALRSIGGYFGGHRIGWDSMVVNAMGLLGEIGQRGPEPLSWVDEPLYHVRYRADSLTHAPETRKGSPMRVALAARYAEKWARMFERRGSRHLLEVIRAEMLADVTAEDEAALAGEAARLRAAMESP